MKIYIVTVTHNENPPDHWNILGVFENEEDADQYFAEVNDEKSEYSIWDIVVRDVQTKYSKYIE